jgi:hypothetical protein
MAARDVPILLHVRNARAICFDQLCDLLSLEIITERPRSLRWRLARLEKAGLVTRLQGQTHLRTPVFRITQQGLIFLESRGHYLLSMPSATEATLHPSQVPHALEMVSTITPESLMSLYKHHHADVLKRGIPNQALFEAYVQYCFSPKHTVGEQLLDVRRDKRERAAYAAAVGDEMSGDQEKEEGDEDDDQRYGVAMA